MNKKYLISTSILCLGMLCIQAQIPGNLDATFGTNGLVVAPVGTGNDQAYAVALQSDGKILVAGNTFTNTTDQEDFFLMRYLPNGTLDASFGTNGKVTTDFGASDDGAKAVAVQPDGKILVAGHTLGATGTGGYNFAAARYLANGTLDTDFGTAGKVVVNFGSTDFCLAMGLQANGRIILAGRSYNGATSDFALVRLLTNGSLDPNYGTDGKVRVDLFNENESINAITFDLAGRVVAVGETSTSTIIGAFVVAKFKLNGQLEDAFGDGGKVRTAFGTESDAAYGVAIQTDGKIVVAGQSNSATISDILVIRYLSNGTLDNTFGTGGILLDDVSTGGDYGYAVHAQADGKILVAGSSSENQEDVALFRYLNDGAPDTDFGDNGVVWTDAGTSMQDRALAIVVKDGKIIVAGQTGILGNFDIFLAKYEQGPVISPTVLVPNKIEAAIYPNPASTQTTLFFNLPQAEELQIRMFNTQGQLVRQWNTGELGAGQQQLQLNWGADMVAGVYRLEMVGSSGVVGVLFVVR